MLTVAVMRTELVKSLRRPAHVRRVRDPRADPDHHGGGDQPQPARRARARAALLFLASQTGLLLPGFALRVTSAFMLVDHRRALRRRCDRRRGELGQPPLPPDAARRARPARGLEVRRRGVLRLARGRARGGHRTVVGSIVFGTASIPSFPRLLPGCSRPATSCTTSLVSTAYVVVEPHRGRRVLVHGVVHDRRAVRRDLRRRRPLLHVADPRRHLVARQHPLRAPHPLLRHLGRPADARASGTPTSGAACSCSSPTSRCSS